MSDIKGGVQVDVIAAAHERLAESGLPSEWLDVPVHWGVKAKDQADPATGGLRFSLLNVDVYGEVPEFWTNNTEIPRGAIARHPHGADGLLDLQQVGGLVGSLRGPL